MNQAWKESFKELYLTNSSRNQSKVKRTGGAAQSRAEPLHRALVSAHRQAMHPQGRDPFSSARPHAMHPMPRVHGQRLCPPGPASSCCVRLRQATWKTVPGGKAVAEAYHRQPQQTASHSDRQQSLSAQEVCLFPCRTDVAKPLALENFAGHTRMLADEASSLYGQMA